MAAESSRAKEDYLKLNFRANIRSPTLFVKRFSSPRRIRFKNHCLPSVFKELSRDSYVLGSLFFAQNDSITLDIPWRDPSAPLPIL
jgi:hypothetical protein